MLESVLTSGKKKPTVDPSIINAGTAAFGYYGEVSSFITGDLLASRIGLTAGVSINSGIPWLKFSFNSKLAFIPMKPLRHSVSWADIYRAGAVYDTTGTGVFPPTTGTVAQRKQVTVSGMNFYVSLMRIKDTDPTSSPIAVSSTYDLFRKCRVDYAANWGVQLYTAAQLGQTTVLTEPAAYNCMINAYSSNTANRLVFQANNLTTVSQISHTDATQRMGWRPILIQV